MKTTDERTADTPSTRVGRTFHGLPAVAAQLENGHGGTGVSWRHLKMVLIGKRPSASLLAQVRERFPQLLPPNGLPWNRADEPTGFGTGGETAE